MLLKNQQFSYVYFFHSDGETNSKWDRHHVSDIPALVKEFSGKHDCYTTIQHYSGPDEVDGEYQIAPLYFDLDSPDSADGINLDQAIKDARKVVEFFISLGIEEHFVRIWFSGKKGFHITVQPECLKIARHRNISYVMRLATDYLALHLELPTYDVSVYSKRRMWRVPNTKHMKTGKYCVELYRSDLYKTPAKIKALASQPRPPLYDAEEYDNINVVELAADWFNRFWTDYHDHIDVQKLGQGNIVEPNRKGTPACAKDLHACGLKKTGTRNSTGLALSSLYRNMEYPIDKTMSIMIQWAKTIPFPLSQTKESERISSIKTVVKSVYDGKYWHSCAYIRSLGAGADTPVACDGDKCKFVRKENQEVKDVIEVSLKESRRSAFIGKKIKFPAFCGAKDSNPFFVPQHGDITCTPNLERSNSPCHMCKIAPQIKELNDDEDKIPAVEQTEPFSIKSDNAVLIEMTDVKTSTQISVIRRIKGIPTNCKKCRVDVATHINMQRIMLNPVVGFESDIIEDMESYESIKSFGFVVNKEVKENQNYNFVGRTVPDPKTSYCMQLIEDLEPREADIDTFRMTPELHEELKVFQGEPTRMFNEIHDDLEQNVYQVWERRDMAIGLDLIYHSALTFNFDGQRVNRGWVQGIFVGDTGQAKSTLAIGLMKHYNCGAFVNCETAGRTGLLYNITTTNNSWTLRWGKMVTQDRMMLIVDELQKLDEQTVSELGGAREHGFVTVDKVESGSAMTRVRMALIANPRRGRIDSMNFGVEAIKLLFESPKDLRRCDFGMVLSANAVSPEVINKRVISTIDPKYTSDRCANLIKWIWSRRRDQIKFTDDATKQILEQAIVFGKKYQCNIPLCEHGDMRFKLARLSAGAAGRVFSTKDGENLIVDKRHVKFATDFLNTIYTVRDMGFHRYAQIDQQKNDLDEKRKLLVSAKIKELKSYRDFCSAVLETISFSVSTLVELCNSDYEEMKKIISIFRKYRLVDTTKHGKFYKNPALTQLLKIMLDEAEEEDENYEKEKEEEEGEYPELF